MLTSVSFFFLFHLVFFLLSSCIGGNKRKEKTSNRGVGLTYMAGLCKKDYGFGR